MLNRLPLELNNCPVYIRTITATETVQAWFRYPKNDLLGVLFAQAKKRYGSRRRWWCFEITSHLKEPKLLKLYLGFKMTAYYAGLKKEDFGVTVTRREGLCFCWFNVISRSQTKELAQLRRDRLKGPRHLRRRSSSALTLLEPALSPGDPDVLPAH